MPDGFDEITDSIMQAEGGGKSSPDVTVPNPFGIMPVNVFEGANSWGTKFMDAGTYAPLKALYEKVKGKTATPEQRAEFEQQYREALNPDVRKKITRQVLKDNPTVMKEIDNLLSTGGTNDKALAKSLTHAAYNMPSATRTAIEKIKGFGGELPAFATALYGGDTAADNLFRDAMYDVAYANVAQLSKSLLARGEDLSAEEYQRRVDATYNRFIAAAGLKPDP